ncbi:MAG: MOSC domain-containing protein [Bryobacteraceae bacterium]|jgi:MOSC domain-containing protein YiiM
MRGLVLQINLSPGGLPKRPVPEAYLTPLGFQGDGVAHPAVHGGPEKALLLVTAETTDELVARGFPLFYGALGENLTTRGLDRRDMRGGMRFRAGQALIELTRPRTPCTSLDVYGPELRRLIPGKDAPPSDPAWAMGGFYASVAEPGWVRAGDIIWVVDAAV